MTKQQLIAALEAEKRYTLNKAYIRFDKAISLVSQLSEPAGWQDVSDVLPEGEDVDVLMAWADENTVRSGKFFGQTTMLNGFAERKGSRYVGKIGVTHWMPLPPAPSPEQKG